MVLKKPATTFVMLMKFTEWKITSTFSSMALALRLSAQGIAAEPVITTSFSRNAAISFCMSFGSVNNEKENDSLFNN